MTTSSPTGGALAGANDLNPKIGDAVYKDLYEAPPEAGAERRELANQARVLGLGFFVFFFLIIGGLSTWINGAWMPGYAVNVPVLPGQELPTEDADQAAYAAYRNHPPEIESDGGWKRLRLDLRYDDGDDVKSDGADLLTPVHLWHGRNWVATGYFYGAPTPGETKVRFPNLEPVTVQTSALNAIDQARLLRLLPTRYLMAIGALMGVLGLLVPTLLIPFYKFWMRFVTAPLGWFNTRLILSVVWFLMFTPIAIVRRLFAEDPLRRASKPEGESYWLKREKRDHKHFARGF